MSVPVRISVACGLAVISCCCALSGCAAPVPRHSQPPQRGSATAESPARRSRSATAPLTVPQLEGVYRQRGRSFVITYQGWWLDLTSQQIRQLTPVRAGAFTATGTGR